MPARRLRLSCSHVFTLIVVVFLVPAGVHAQTGGASVALKASVSKTVALSVFPNFTSGDIEASVVSSGNGGRLTLSIRGSDSSVIRVPLLVRSNSGFKISAAFESETTALAELAVTDVRATGRLVAPHIVSALEITRQFDVSRPLPLLSGPRVSLGGTLHSPNNALQITLLIRLKPKQPVRDWLVQLTFVGTPE
jgi:hypothetical protein